MNKLNITFKRGINTIDLSAEGYGVFQQKVTDVFVDGEFKMFISKDEVLKDYSAFEDNDSEMVAGGQTLKECKENVQRVLLKEAREDNQDAYEDAVLERRHMRNVKDACTTPSERFEAQEAIDIAQAKLDALQSEFEAILERLKPLMPSHARSMAQIRLGKSAQ